MRFIDEATIRVSAGHGGPGCVAFRREKYVPRGGPNGGDGGDGGDIIFVATAQLSTLQDFRFKRVYQAQNGQPGLGSNKAGPDGEDIQIRIPVGTIIKDAQTGEVLVDFVENGQAWVACEGGRGGKGNAHFVTSTFQAPKFAQDGEEGGSKELVLELKLLADVGIIGFPNAGKSTLISRISAARPKIADYPFTTLTPNLGVVSLSDGDSFVVADIPGLIEGAHRGVGLGHKFLKHIERTRIFVHMLDGNRLLDDVTRPDPSDSAEPVPADAIEDLVQRYNTIRKELELFNAELLTKKEFVVLNKLDVIQADTELIRRAKESLKRATGKEAFVISAATGAGVQDLLNAIHLELVTPREK